MRLRQRERWSIGPSHSHSPPLAARQPNAMARLVNKAGLWLLALALAGSALAAVAAPPAEAAKRPNLVLITTDDQPPRTFQRQYMPRTFRDLVDRGTNFTDAIVNVPLCCPSRSTLLTGQYGHNHRVLSNRPGYPRLRGKSNVLPKWLQRAGYRTAHVGKWLHGYDAAKGKQAAPGWDRWFTQYKRRRYYNYRVSNGRKTIRKGKRARDHVTPVMTRAASEFVRRKAPKRRPLYLQLDYYGPHRGPQTVPVGCTASAQPERRDRRRFPNAIAPRVPSFNEQDMSDKPYFARRGKLDASDIRALDQRYRCMLRTLAGVDRGIAKVVRQFRKAGELRNTAFVFLTDNGFFAGEHRLSAGKSRPYEASIGTPMVMRLPGGLGRPQRTVSTQVAEFDIVPTLLELAEAEPCKRRRCRTLDGRSLLAPAFGDDSDFRDRGVLIEMDDTPPPGSKSAKACTYTAIRTSEQILIENTRIPDPRTKQCIERTLYESYDLERDPFELENLVPAPGADVNPQQSGLLKRLDAIRSCSGIRGRDPRSAGGFCE